MRGVLQRLRDLLRLFFTGHGQGVWRAVSERLYSNGGSLGLRRDLAVPLPVPTAKRPIQVRPLAPEDDLSFLDIDRPGLSADQVFARLGQRRILQSGLATCYVAIGPGGTPCYMQWLIPSGENDRVRTCFLNLYPHLGPDEVLLEGAYTPEAHRGQGIMASAMAQIAQRAAHSGARWAITFVDQGNTPSLKGCERAGFVPYLRRVEMYRLFHRVVAFMPLLTSALPGVGA